jgi:hypothetical protein
MGVGESIALIALAATAAGTGVAVAGQQQQARAAENAAEFNAKVEQNNALAAQQQAEAEALQIRRTNRLRAGAARASYGKAGVNLEAANDVLFDAGTQGELEALSALYAGQTQSAYYQSRARGARFEGRNAASAARLQSVSTIIGGVAQGASIYGDYNHRKSSKQPGFGKAS